MANAAHRGAVIISFCVSSSVQRRCGCCSAPPGIRDHAVHGGHGAGADAGVAGARHGRCNAGNRPVEPGAVSDQNDAGPWSIGGETYPRSRRAFDRPRSTPPAWAFRPAASPGAAPARWEMAVSRITTSSAASVFHMRGRNLQSAGVKTATDSRPPWRCDADRGPSAARAPSLDESSSGRPLTSRIPQSNVGIVAEETYPRRSPIPPASPTCCRARPHAEVGSPAGQARGRRPSRRIA